MSLRLKIVTPERVAYDGDIVSVSVPGSSGSFEILENHAPHHICARPGNGGIHYGRWQTRNPYIRRLRRGEEERGELVCGTIVYDVWADLHMTTRTTT